MDEDAGDTLRYSRSGAGAGSFSINSGTGKLTSTAELDSAVTSSYTVTVTATDSRGASDDTEVTIDVKGVTAKDNKKPQSSPILKPVLAQCA